jgi:hypothetical protein
MTATADAPLPIDYDPPADVDGEAADVLAVYHGVLVTFDAVLDTLDEGAPPENLTQDDIDAFEAAYETGRQLREHQAHEAFLEEGLAALPEDLVDDIDEHLAPFATAFGIDLDLDLDRPSDDVELLAGLTAGVTRRGS